VTGPPASAVRSATPSTLPIDITGMVIGVVTLASSGRPGAGLPAVLWAMITATAPAAWALAALSSPEQLPRLTSAIWPATLVVSGSQPSSAEAPPPSCAATTVAVRS
jgi:hypothetical protein